jgi:competence protein ComEA
MDPPRACAQAVASSNVVTAWPKAAQLATAFLFGAAGALLSVHAWGFSRWGARPAELETPLAAYRIDLNAANKAELLQMPGVGESLAERIDSYRREYGAFRQVDEITRIHGVGPATLERLRPWVQVAGDSTPNDRLPSGDATARGRKPEMKAPSASSGIPGTKKIASLRGVINVNYASEEELQRLPGIGLKMAQRIVAERLKKPFSSVDELRRVHGIGAKTLERLRPFVTAESTSLRVAAAAQS